tara:strand:- start:15708 stop:16004 length:297 start_codon:yes stop_codon:yes gene_type:complete
MGIFKKVDTMLQPAEKKIEKHLTKMNMSCHRLILFDSLLWLLFIIYYIGHFFYTKQFTDFEEKHKGYEKVIGEKDMIIIVFCCLAALLYLHFFILSRN